MSHCPIPVVRDRRCPAAVSLLAAAVLVATGCGPRGGAHGRSPGPSPDAASRHPAPTEHWLDGDAERRNKAARRKWIADMHRAAPGVDWRALERENGRRRTERRLRAVLAKDYVAGTWTERGSRNQAGRMHAIALGLDGLTLFGGSSGGGAWTATTDGADWVPLGDNLWGGAHHVAVGAGPAETLVALTNWGRLRYSTDRGATWLEPTGLPGDVAAGVRLLNDASARNVVYALLRRGGTNELYRSDDGGASWLFLLDTASGRADVWMDRVDGGSVYLLADGDVSRSDDGGRSWRALGTIGPGPFERVVLAGSEAGNPTLYATVRPPGGPDRLHVSTNGGRGWQFLSDVTDYWGTLEASITSSDLVVTGGVEVFRSEDGGRTFSLVNPWWEYYGDPVARLHADVPGIDAVLVDGAEVFFISTDGGLFRSDDGLLSVRNVSRAGLGVSQYYSTLTSVRDPYLVLAGAQDQGYQRSRGRGAPLMDFDQLISGDYAHLTSGDGTHSWVYSVYPGFVLVQEGESAPQLSQLDFPPGAAMLWMPPVLADPTDRQAFYLCADRLWRYQRDRATGDWAMELATDQDFTVAGGWTLSALSISRLDPDRRLAVTNEGVFWVSDDGGVSWTASPDRGPSSHYFYGTALVHSPLDPLVAHAGGAGYSGPGVYRTDDGGVTWSPLGDGLPPTMVYGLAHESESSDVLYAATEAGPYRLDPSTSTWEDIAGGEAPLTTYWSVEAVPSIGVVRFGTYGRGVWDYQARVVPESERCGDGIDNDDNGLVDCDDPGCIDADDCPEDCWNGIDDDGDLEVDCEDVDCTDEPACPENCTNRVDDDADGLVDCDDEECRGAPWCPENCTNGADDDGDGRIDCQDPECSEDVACPEDCGNGSDDDADGDVDCDDVECTSADADGDGVSDCDDCAPGDPGLGSSPSEVVLLLGARRPGATVVDWSWSAEGQAAGAATGHDLLRGSLDALRASGWPSPALCVVDDEAGLTWPDEPGPGAHWYLVRADNPCGTGGAGSGSTTGRVPATDCD